MMNLKTPRWISYVKLVAILFLLVPSFIWTAKPAYALTYEYLNYPQGNVGIVRPVIGLNVTFSDGMTPQSYHFYVNGEEVAVNYDPTTAKYDYVPKSDLSSGNYQAKMEFQFKGYSPIKIEWSFSVSKSAVSLASTVTKEQEDGLQAINDYRLKLGLSKVKFSDGLNTVAQKHAQYLLQNKIDPIKTAVSLHDENPALPGFIGNSLKERAQYIGYTRASSEDVASNPVPLIEAIDSLFDAPYHRSPFLAPNLDEIGVFRAGDYHVIEFGFADGGSPDLVVSPSNNDSYVPTNFDGHETPDPLRIHSSLNYPVGYPVMAAVNGQGVKKVTLVDAEIRDESGTTLTLLTNDSSNDNHLTNEVIVMPDKPLAFDRTYKAKMTLSAVMEDGTTKLFSKEWTFHTEPSAGLGVAKLHADAAAYAAQMAQPFRVGAHVVTFGLNGNSYTLDQVPFPMKQKPYIQDGSSYLYIRDLAAALGATVEWNDQLKAAVYKKGDKNLLFYTNRSAFSVNGVEKVTQTPALLINETTMIPVRLLSEALGANVAYEESTRTVTIKY
ncbi:S-layer protein [Paenibacillus alba]|uniref:stalk domain-containing protein n=1 Tax=Paenibacillus alba TaxID=1197127 RepID=UPI001565F444|nr:stalk domain-containing protein [Paenibacillus alba]NQX64925.1 S-layer protein [Paenibacillus alba]